MRSLGICLFIGGALLFPVCSARGAELDRDDLFALSIEELMQVDISMASRKAEPLFQTPAAVHVITPEDMQHHGVQDIAEALRLVPGMQVSRINASRWAVSARGFQYEFSNKLLVQVDGRVVYWPVYSGVFWNIQDLVMNDIDRIEVMLGPGGALWGANAVNGVVNIMTKSAAETQGTLIEGGVSSIDNVNTSARYGDRINEDTHYRVYGLYRDRKELESPEGEGTGDDAELKKAGFRLDYTPDSEMAVVLQGDVYQGVDYLERIHLLLEPPYRDDLRDKIDSTGGNVLARISKSGVDTESIVQLFYDVAERNQAILDASVKTADLDAQHRLSVGEHNEVTVGGGYRHTREELDPLIQDSVRDDEQSLNLYSLFIQDRMSLGPKGLSVILGTKAERNDHTGWEWHPSLRLLYAPNEAHTLWASVSRAVRIPTSSETVLNIYFRVEPPDPAEGRTVPRYSTVGGTADLDAEELLAYELGYRAKLNRNLSTDLALFVNEYDSFIGVTRGAEYTVAFDSGTYEVSPLQRVNIEDQVQTYGGEFGINWKPADFSRIRAHYSYLNDDDATSQSRFIEPEHRLMLSADFELPRFLQLHTALFYVDEDPSSDPASTIDSYTRVDLGLRWVRDSVVLSTGVQDLFNDGRVEETGRASGNLHASEIPRMFYVNARLTF